MRDTSNTKEIVGRRSRKTSNWQVANINSVFPAFSLTFVFCSIILLKLKLLSAQIYCHDKAKDVSFV